MTDFLQYLLSVGRLFIKTSTHPRAYGNFARLLGKYVRDEHVIPMEEAIRKLTSLPASTLRIKERGSLEKGYFADVVVFDPKTIGDRSTYEKPHQYATGMTPPGARAVARAATALGTTTKVTIPAPEAARAAAYVITSIEAASLQRENLRTRPQDFDPATRDRFLAGFLLPADWYIRAQRFRSWFRQAMHELFHQVDVIIAPTAPFEAPRFTDQTLQVDGQTIPVRPTIGRFTQPLSLIGLPILAVPIHIPGALPVGVQLIGPPWSEPTLLRVARTLETCFPAPFQGGAEPAKVPRTCSVGGMPAEGGGG